MQLRHIRTIHQATDLVDGRFQKVTAMAWSANKMRLAVATVDRMVLLYDENGDKRDSFRTRPAKDSGARNYLVRGLEFSPDSTRLAVAQSDGIVFVYKLGLRWEDTKTICNKFEVPAGVSVTSLCWPWRRPEGVVFGASDGVVRIGILANQKTRAMYSTDSYTVALASSPEGNAFISGHMDGTIRRYTFADGDTKPTQATIVQTSYPPYALSWGEHIGAAGHTGVVQMFDQRGHQVQQFDYSSASNVKEFTVASFSPSGQTLVMGNFDKFFVYVYNAGRSTWEEAKATEIPNLYSVTALRWKSDGSRLVVGSLCGAVDIYDACIRRYLYKGKYEFTYTSLSSVVVKVLATGALVSLSSKFKREIKKIEVYQNRYLIAHTTHTLIACDLQTQLHSEVPWQSIYSTAHPASAASPTAASAPSGLLGDGGAKERFYFDNENACMVYKAGELTVIEYGRQEPLVAARTELCSPYLVSLRINEGRTASEQAIKKLAYLLDAQTIRVLDLGSSSVSSSAAILSPSSYSSSSSSSSSVTTTIQATCNHDAKIDWLELNPRGSKLLFRDKRRALHLLDVATQTRSTLLNYCNYVQWVPDSDVVVAQSRHSLCVWYSIDHPTDVTTIPINGDVEQIERGAGETKILIDEGIQQRWLPLDESLIAFGSAVDARDYHKAVAILERLPASSASAEAMWLQLAQLALQQLDFVVAERCYSAVGDVSKREYMRQINLLVAENGGNKEHYLVDAKLAMLAKQFKRAEIILLNQGAVDEAIAMYRQLHKWNDALSLAESRNHQSVEALRQEYYQYLLATNQDHVAGELKEQAGDLGAALQLYLRGGYPAKAAALVMQQGYQPDASVLEQIAAALRKSKNFEKEGEFLESLKLHKRALDAYVRGHVYWRAVELSRAAFPAQVVRLEEEWGDWLMTQKQYDGACNHYVQAGAASKSIAAAIEAGQYNKAVNLLEQLDAASARPFAKRIAHFFAKNGDHAQAERQFIAAGLANEAVIMYCAANDWDRALKLAHTYLPASEQNELFLAQAQAQESQGRWKEAERLYVAGGQVNAAILMYEKNKQWEQFLALTAQHRKEKHTEALLFVGRQYESEGNYKAAEQYYLRAKEWKPAVSMYRDLELWDDALRVCKSHGGPEPYRALVFDYAKTLGGEAGLKMLAKKNLSELAVDYAIESSNFADAFSMAESLCPAKLPEVHLQFAMANEDEGHFAKAEEHFLKAKKPKEAIDMYLHQQDWEQAMRVAEAALPSCIPDVYEARGRAMVEQKNFNAAESYFLSAKKPDLAVKAWQSAGQIDEALRVARQHVPRSVAALQAEKLSMMQNSAGADTLDFLLQQGQMYEQQKQWQAAIDSYLKINQSHSNDLNQLCHAWDCAVQIALEQFSPPPSATSAMQQQHQQRILMVCEAAAQRMVEIGRHEMAADVMMAAQAYKSAIDICLQAKLFEKARSIANTHAPQFRDMIEGEMQGELIRNNKLGDLSPEVAIGEHMKRNEWTKVYDLARKLGDATLVKYVSLHATQLVKDEQYSQALELLTGPMMRGGVPCVPANFPLYKKLAQHILAGTEENKQGGTFDEKQAQDMPAGHDKLRAMLYKLVAELKDVDPSGSNTLELERYLTIAHFSTLRAACIKMGLKTVAAKLAVAMLRYTVELPADKAYFTAGVACRDQGWDNMAFVFLNRFTDIVDLVSNPRNEDIDNMDFIDTDIPAPHLIPVPPRMNFSENTAEDIRDWVLDNALSKQAGAQQLGTRICDKCNQETYEAGLVCHKCNCNYEPCVVTGYPVVRGQRVQCSSCQKPALKDFWTQYVMKNKSCPWCNNHASPVF